MNRPNVEPSNASSGLLSQADRAMIEEWVTRHEQAGHVFFWYEPIGEVIHLVPSNWKAEYFKSLYRDAINLFLYERECEAMACYLVGQEDF
jgi:hypothetical protein